MPIQPPWNRPVALPGPGTSVYRPSLPTRPGAVYDSRLPGKSLQVGAVCWDMACWERSAEFELALNAWAEFGLSRYSASRGLDTLERAGLVSVGRMPGRPPVVTIMDATAENP
jgi:hypothetical protein